MPRASVRVKIATMLTLAGVVPTIAFATMLYFASADIDDSNAAQYSLAAGTTIEKVERNLFERYGDVQAFGYNTAAHDPRNWKSPAASNPLVSAMNSHAAAYGFYNLMLLVSPDGTVLAVNNKSPKGEDIDTESLYNVNVSDRAWFEDAIKGNFLQGSKGLTGTVVGAPEQNELVDRIYGKGPLNHGLFRPGQGYLRQSRRRLDKFRGFQPR